MAITFQNTPLKFFNVNEPAIFEFTSDEDLGVNPNDLVADLELKSLYTNRKYTIKNILPKYGTGVFRIDVSGYLKSLLLDNFEYDYNSSNKQYTYEKFQIGVSVHAENPADPFGDEYVFDSGYIFDTTFVFAELVPNDTDAADFYPIVGMSQTSEAPRPLPRDTRIHVLGPKYMEFAEGFTNTVSLFVGQLASEPGLFVIVGDAAVPIVPIVGVSTTELTDNQISKMYLPALIDTYLANTDILVYGISYKESDCEDTLQFRYFTSYGGYAYFFTPKEALTASRGKTDFVNNDFYNQQEGKSARRQRAAEYKEQLSLSGVKQIELRETFLELLRSPKIEVLLPRGYTECEVTGSHNLRKMDFEYTLNVDIANENQMQL